MKRKEALCKQTALDKAANNIKLASIIYNSIKIGKQSCNHEITGLFFININAFLRMTINKATRPDHAHMYSDQG